MNIKGYLRVRTYEIDSPTYDRPRRGPPIGFTRKYFPQHILAMKKIRKG